MLKQIAGHFSCRPAGETSGQLVILSWSELEIEVGSRSVGVRADGAHFPFPLGLARREGARAWHSHGHLIVAWTGDGPLACCEEV